MTSPGQWLDVSPLGSLDVIGCACKGSKAVLEGSKRSIGVTESEPRRLCWGQAISGTGAEREVLNSMRPRVKKFCMYSERNSGSNWVASLLQVRACK